MKSTPEGVRNPPLSLLDVFETIPLVFELEWPGTGLGRSLLEVAAEADAPNRAVMSHHHAAGAMPGAGMPRKGGWKDIAYIGVAPELFDLVDDPPDEVDQVPT